jgi:hypothetical protein
MRRTRTDHLDPMRRWLTDRPLALSIHGPIRLGIFLDR